MADDTSEQAGEEKETFQGRVEAVLVVMREKGVTFRAVPFRSGQATIAADIEPVDLRQQVAG